MRGLVAFVERAFKWLQGIGWLPLLVARVAFAAAALTVVMTVAILTAHIRDAHTIGDFFYLPEPAYIVIFLILISQGAGRISVDHLIAARRAARA